MNARKQKQGPGVSLNNLRRILGGNRKEEKEERSIKPGLPSKILVTTPKEQEIKIGTANTTPSVVGCKFNRKGFCLTHLDQAEKQKISSKVWQDRGGGRGYGFVTRKVTKYLCRHRVKTIPQLSDVSTERGSVITTTNKSPNLSEPGRKDENILTGFMGTSSGDFESETCMDLDGLSQRKEKMWSATGD